MNLLPTSNRWIRVCVIVGLAFVYQQNFLHNFMRVGKEYIAGKWQAEVFETYQGDTAMHVPIMVRQVRQGGLGRLLRPMPNYGDGYELTYYPSCFGLQAKVVGLFGVLVRSGDAEYIAFAQACVALLMGFVMAAVFEMTRREFGGVASVVFLLLSLSSDWLVFVGRHLYHVFFTCLLPFMYAWVRFPMYADGKRSTWPFLFFIGMFVALRAMCSYEYITNVILGATVGPYYYLILNRVRGYGLLKWGGGIVLAGVIGVLVAMGLHAMQNCYAFGSWAQGWEAVSKIAVARSYGSDGGIKSAIDNVPLLRIIDAYLFQNALSVPFLGYRQTVFLTIGAACAVVTALMLSAVAWHRSGKTCPGEASDLRSRLFALTTATFWGMCCTFTWPFLMKGHMFHHIHMAPKLFYIPFLLTYYILLGYLVQLFCRRVMSRARTRTVALDGENTGESVNPAARVIVENSRKKRSALPNRKAHDEE